MSLKTPLYDIHTTLSAHFCDFHGYQMPMEYEGIIKEHTAVRSGVGIFDISHMGEFYLRGRHARSFLQYLVTNDIGKLVPGKALYTPLCNPSGGIIDDIIVYMMENEAYLLVVNSANIENDLSWLEEHRSGLTNDLLLEDRSERTALIALQGPRSPLALQGFASSQLSVLGRYSFTRTQLGSFDVIVSRTGSTAARSCSGTAGATLLAKQLAEQDGRRSPLLLARPRTWLMSDVRERTSASRERSTARWACA